jgi:CBS domain containing-hemolysin-like protein
MELFIASVTCALILSFICSLAEATVLSLTPGEVANIRSRHPRIGKTWHQFKKHIDRPIVVILFLNTAAHTIGATVAGAEFEKIWGGTGIVWFSLAFTLAILFFTEIVPKTLGVTYRRSLASPMAPILNFLITMFRPFIWLSRLFSHPFTRFKKPETALAAEELRSLAAHARLSKEIGTYQARIITEASQLADKQAKDIMIPRKDLIYFDIAQPMEDLLTKAHLEPHTRFPIVRNGNLDEFLGYVNFKELLFLAKNNPINPTVEGIIRPVRFITPYVRLTQLLRMFIEEHIHLAIVQDKEHHTLGLVTLEDIIEEMLGNIEDEFDRLPKMVHPLVGGTWMVGGGVHWRDI